MALKLDFIIHFAEFFLGHESRHMKVHFSAKQKEIRIYLPSMPNLHILQIR